MRVRISLDTLIAALTAVLPAAHKDTEKPVAGVRLAVRPDDDDGESLDIVATDERWIAVWTERRARVEGSGDTRAMTLTVPAAKALLAWLKTQAGVDVAIDFSRGAVDERMLDLRPSHEDYPAYRAILTHTLGEVAGRSAFNANLLGPAIKAFAGALKSRRVPTTIEFRWGDPLDPVYMSAPGAPLVVVLMPVRL